MFHFGFSYVGLIYLLMLFIPNGIWAKNQPKDYEQYVKNENKVLQIFERVGEVLVCCFVLIFSDFNIRFNSIWCLWLAVSFLFMLLYELYWLKYFRSEKTMADFYSSICGVPVAGATLPVCAFFLLGIYGCNILLIVSVVILGIGHIGIHLNHYKEIHENTGAVKKKGNIARGIMKWVILVVCVIVFGLIAVIIGCRNVNYMTHYINPEQGVDEGVYIPLGGQEQYLLIRGRNVENPVMIWLHGGPSSPDAMVNYIFQNDLIDDYTIINWEQRGCGRTYFRNMKKDPAWTTPVKYSEDYCNSISAPQKKFALLEGCGHSPQYGEPEEFSDILHSMLNEFGKSWS